MSNNITPDTNFSSITITNDYPCLVGGTWTATLVNGVTVYSNGTDTHTGAVNLIGGTLTISNGAIVTDLTAINNPTITVNSGGTIKNSDVFNGNVSIGADAISENNNYISSSLNLLSKSTSSSDYFYYPGVTPLISGTLNLSELPFGTSTSFQTSDGTKSSISTNSVSWGTNYTFKDPHFPDISSRNSSTLKTGSQKIWLGPASQFGNAALAPTVDYTSGNYIISNANKTYVGGTWIASLVNGVTVYSNGDGTVTNVTGPINFINIVSLGINRGAVVDGITVSTTTDIANTSTIIKNAGTIQNSFITHSDVSNYNVGMSKNNTYVGITYTGAEGSTTSEDVFYIDSTTSQVTLDFSQMPAGTTTTATLNNGGTVINLNKGATWDNSYAGTNNTNGSSGQLTINRYFGSVVACFLTGTMINTTNGYIAIEDIQIGDKVITYNGTKQEIKSIIWKGYNTVKVNPNLDDNEAGYPIRVLKNAISDGVPYKDLLITPEHCLFFDNQFVPAYMLVNDFTIFYDLSITEYTYYHIETEIHSIIDADGMLTESYLDTGNRHGYYQDENVISIHNEHKSWNIDSAAPLVTTRETIEPIFNRIIQRIQSLGLTYIPKVLSTTDDSGLYLITDAGTAINKASEREGRYIFIIPADTCNVRLISKTSKPSSVIGAFVDDRRDLGVLVGNITLLERNHSHNIDTHLTSANMPGWDKELPQTYRWTNGNAYLELPPTIDNSATRVLVIQVVASGPYLLHDIINEETQLETSKAG